MTVQGNLSVTGPAMASEKPAKADSGIRDRFVGHAICLQLPFQATSLRTLVHRMIILRV